MPQPRLFETEREYTNPRLTCYTCGLFTKPGIQTKQMNPFGEFRKRIMVIGEAPGADEDRKGRPWQGRTGTLLRDTLREFDIDLFKDCISLNSVNCRPPNNRDPTANEIDCCRTVKVMPAIQSNHPSVILLMGGSAVASVIGSINKDAADPTIGRWRGFAVPIPEWNCWLCPTYHPSYVMREDKRAEIETIWKRDIEQALTYVDKPVPQPGNLRDLVMMPRDELGIVRALQRVLRRKGWFSFDYETEGLNPIVHKLVSASFATDETCATAFMFNGSEQVNQLWKSILEDDAIGKIAHNAKFEYAWSRVHFGVDEIAWGWDSMISAHTLDNRPGICGLKHQSFLNFGITGYDDVVAPFLASTNSRDPRSPNRIREFIKRHGADELLIYNGLDSLLGFRLAMRQMERINGSAGRQ